MLNIGRLGAAAAEYYLGEVAASPEEYYTGHGESAGRWVGSLGPALGLHGEVGADDLRAVLNGCHPLTGEQLVVRQATAPAGPPQREHLPLQDDRYDLPRAASRLHLSIRQVQRLLWAGERADAGTDAAYLVGERRAHEDGAGRPTWFVRRSELERFEATTAPRRGRTGFDLTLRPPKSVSVLWALADDDVRLEIRNAHREAVDAVIAHLERHALVSRRRRGDRVESIGADGFVAAAFDHRTSRAGDPLLHTHVVTANLTKTVDGRWRSLDARPIYEQARPAGVLYQAHLRHVLAARLGVEWDAVRNGWAEVKGVPREVIRAFSKRSDEIEQVLAESGYSSARARQAATLASRRPKDRTADPLALVDGWRREAGALGFDGQAISACLGHSRLAPALDADAVLDALAAPDGLTKHASSFTRSDVVEAIAERSSSELDARTIDEMADQFLGSNRVVSVAAAPGGELVWRRGDALERDLDRIRFTTPDLIAMEADLLRWAGSALAGEVRPVDPSVVGQVLDRHPSLSDEQRAMVRSLAARQAAVQAVAGRPGSGKTTATAVYVEALAAADVPVVGCALAATAAGELERACDFRGRTGRSASTIARLLIELDRAALHRGCVVVVDEASMVGTRDLHRLATHAAAVGGALVLVGDPDQHGAVETGGVFRAVVASQETSTLLANNRQREPRDRRAIELFREGNVEAALRRYDDADMVVRSATASSSFDRMVEDWWEHARLGNHDPMIVGTNHARRQLNARARQRLVAAGMVWGPSVCGRDEAELAIGDWVVARRNDRQVATADREGIRNGDCGRVVDVDPSAGTIAVAFDDKGVVRLPPAYVSEHVQHAYARTTYGVQGATLERAFVHVDDRTGFEEAYVAMTRGRLETRLYLVDGTALDDDDNGHRAHVRADTGLDTVAEAMRRRRAGVMVHDLDPLVSATSAAASQDLAWLRQERRRLELVFQGGPHDVAELLREAVDARDRVRALLRAADLTPGRGTDRKRTRLDGEHECLTLRIRALRERHKRRQAFLAAHESEVHELRVVRRAELAREAKVRAAAREHPAEALTALLGRGPIADRSIADAAEALAVHAERFGILPGEDVGAALGSPPAEAGARLSYERVERLVRAAESTPVEVVLPERAPSLFD